MTTPVTRILTEFGIQTNDPNAVTWTLPERLLWLNEGQLELHTKKSDACIKTTTMSLVGGAKQSNPTGCTEIIELRQNASGDAIIPCQRSALDAFLPGWMSGTQSAVVKHYMDDPNPEVFYVYPPATNGTQVVVTYTAVPDTVTDTDNLSVRDIYATKILNYMLYRAYSKDADAGYADRAAAYYKLFSE